MKCPDDGKLLAYLEDQLPAPESAGLEGHLASCRFCARRLQVLKEDLEFCREKTWDVLKEYGEARVTGQYRVWEALQEAEHPKRGVTIWMKMRKVAMAAVIVVACAALLSIPSVQAAAGNLLQVFRVDKVSTITLNPQDISQIQAAIKQGNQSFDIEQFGKIKMVGERQSQTVAASDLAQLPFPVKLPAQWSEDKLVITREKTPDVEVTPNVANVNQLLKSLGSKYQLPAALNGQTFQVTMPEMVVVKYEGYRLIQGPSPEIQVPSGVNVNEVRQAILELPIWPQDVRNQLEAIQDWQHTLVIPDDGQHARQVTVNGKPAVYSDQGRGALLVWQQDGRLFMLQSDSLTGEQNLIKIAESLR